MKVAIICYDLKHVHGYENIFVKAALAKLVNTTFTAITDNLLSPFPEWVRLTLPDTTFLASVPDATTSELLISEVLNVIQTTGAEAGKSLRGFYRSQFEFALQFGNEASPAITFRKSNGQVGKVGLDAVEGWF